MTKPKTTKKPQKLSKKMRVQQELFDICQARKNMVFDNALVKEISNNHKFGNAFDVTKIDNSSVLAPDIINKDYCIAHLGEGKHQFLQAASCWFRSFEAISDAPVIWPYRKSILNEIDTSESNILSVGFNQRIIHDFLYEDIVASPKMYGARRTKYTGSYKINGHPIQLDKLQMEIDLTTEYQGQVTIFEGKNKFPQDFAVYQLFHPFIYFHQLQNNGDIKVKEMNCCYLCREMQDDSSIIRLYLYSFEDPSEIASIKLIKNAEYRLVKR